MCRLVQRAEDLEALMNEEVTDINELISVINNIQVLYVLCRYCICVIIYLFSNFIY